MRIRRHIRRVAISIHALRKESDGGREAAILSLLEAFQSTLSVRRATR